MRLSFSDQRKPNGAANGADHAPLCAPLPANAPMADDPELTQYLNLKATIHRSLIQRLNLASIERMPVEQLRPEVDRLVSELLAQDALPLNSSEKVRLTDD